MQLFQFLSTWLFPGAVYAAAADVAVSSEHDRTSSSSPTLFSVKAAEAGSSLSSPSSSSSSSSDDRAHRFFPPRKQTPSLCFGAGGAGRLLWGGARSRAPAKQDDDVAAAAASTAAKGDAVGRYLRRISGRMRKARSAGKASASASLGGAGDDTARERAESVARAIAYCKDTLRRGAAPPTPPSPSLDDWLHLHDRQEEIEIIASTEAHGNERRDSPRMESPCPATSPSRDDDGSLTSAAAVVLVHGKEPSRHHHDHGAGDECRGESVKAAETATKSSSPSDLAAAGNLEMLSSFDKMEFLKIFDGDEEMIDHHFITIQI